MPLEQQSRDWGLFSHSRGSISDADVAFIQAKGLARVPVSHIARMSGRSIPDVQRIINETPAAPLKSRRRAKAIRKAIPVRQVEAMPPRVRSILCGVALGSGLLPSDLTGQSRAAKIVDARHYAMWRVRKEIGASFPKIGTWFGGRDHTTAMNAYRRVERQRAELAREGETGRA